MLYQKYKPKKFSEVAGHKSNLLAFNKKSINQDYPSVMFFTGSTGTGKTTSALLIASIVNCTSLVKNSEGYNDPCGICHSCKSIQNEFFGRDVFIYDGTSIGKEGIVDLESTASSSPMFDKKRIIVIDEFQALSGSAKGATLKLLEKVRKDTIFILCMMDTTGLDKAILARGLTYDFKPLTPKEVGERLLEVLDKEDPEQKIPDSFVTEGLVLIAENCGGSLRKAFDDMERCIDSELYTGEDITRELGFITEEKTYQIFDKMLRKDWSVFEDFKKLPDLSQLFVYCFNILRGTFSLVQSKNMDDWKVKSAIQLMGKYPKGVRDLLQVFIKTKESSLNYFNAQLFESYLIQYMDEQSPVGLTKTEPKKRIALNV